VRARHRAAVLLFDNDPYLVVSDSGRLRWILDAYTATSPLPYAQPLDDGTTYMRNSVKVVIDAFDGTVTAYVADPRDRWCSPSAKVFPGILPAARREMSRTCGPLRYPRTCSGLQTDVRHLPHGRAGRLLPPGGPVAEAVLSRPGERPDPFLRTS